MVIYNFNWAVWVLCPCLQADRNGLSSWLAGKWLKGWAACLWLRQSVQRFPLFVTHSYISEALHHSHRMTSDPSHWRRWLRNVLKDCHKSTSASNQRSARAPPVVYHHNRSVEDAVILVFSSVFWTPRESRVRILFADLSSAFNTIKPHVLARKLMQPNVSREIIVWILSFLTVRKQRVCIKDVMSSLITTSIGAQQGYILPTVLFILNGCHCPSIKLITFSGDYKTKTQNVFSWSMESSLQLNVSKSKELVGDWLQDFSFPAPFA